MRTPIARPATVTVPRHSCLGYLTIAALLLSSIAHAGGGRNRVVGSEATIPALRCAITIDADLSDWDEAEAILLTTGNPGNAGHGKGAFDDNNARIAFRYDADALYVAGWWQDPTPLGVEVTPGVVPASDGLILHIPHHGAIHHVALWKVPQEDAARALHSVGRVPLAQGKSLSGVEQAYRVTGDTNWTQEVRLPWSAIGSMPAANATLRLGIELCFGGLDMTAGYRMWLEELAAHGSSGSRWGGNICWGFVDGIRDEKVVNPRFDPANGALVELKAAGATAPANPPVMFMGNEQTRTTRMIAVPAPVSGVTVDGVLGDDEWPEATGTTIASEPSLFPRRYETRIHWAYNAEGLYVGLRWFTGGPQLNINNPAPLNRGYDGGDAIQIRLGAPDRVSHIDTWFYTGGWRPAMAIAYGAKFDEGNLEDALVEGAKMAIEPFAQGYTQEIFLPWKLITRTGEPLAEGENFQVILDLFYSGLEQNRMPFIVNASLAPLTGILDLPYSTPRDGYYTAVIETADGQGVRRLLAHKKLAAKQILNDWDGLDAAGNPVPAGRYRVRGLHHTGVGLDYLMTYVNPGNPPWQTYDGTGEWGGDHCPPQAVAADDWGIYLGWPAAEDGNGIIATDFAGQKRWNFFGTPQPTGCGSAILASDGNNIYFGSDVLTAADRARAKDQTELAHFKTTIACLDRETGRRRGFTIDQPYRTLAEFDTGQVALHEQWQLWQDRHFDLDNHGIHDDYFFSGRSIGANLTGLAARDGKLYAALRIPQQVVVYTVEPFAEVACWDVPKPAGLAFAKDGRLLAISGNSVVALVDGNATPVVADGLDAPVDLAVDADGNLYVSQWGDSHCVAVFAPDGKPLRTIGKPGGRPALGTYDPNGMILPRGIDIGPEGQLWVCEDDNFPRRVSVWNAATGKLVREFVGGTTYGATKGGMIDPKRPDRAISLGVLYEIDLSKEGYRPLATMWRRQYVDQIYPLLGGIYAGWGHNLGFAEHAGQRYITTGGGGIAIIGKWNQDETWQACAAIGGVFNRGDNPQVLPPGKRWWRHGLQPTFFRKHAGESFVWTDLNDDGRVQEEEFQWEKQSADFPCLGLSWGPGGVDADLNVTLASHQGKGHIWRFPVQGYTETGIPRYDLGKRKLLLVPGERLCAVGTDSKGNILTHQRGEWAKPNFQPALRGYSPDGKLLWRYPAHRDVRPMGNINGEGFLGPIDAGGELGEIFGLTQWHGGQLPLMTSDGLFVGRLLRDPSAGGEPGPDVYRGETVQYLNQLDDGRIILAHGKNAHHLMQVTGLDTVKRFQVEFELTAEQAALAAERLAARRREDTANAPIRMMRRETPPAIDGNLDDWDTATAAAIGPQDVTPKARIMLAYHDKHVYLAYDVVKTGGYLNTGKGPLRLFLGGDAVDLQFAADPAARKDRKEPIVGDTRLLIAKHDGKPVAVVYRARVPGAKNPVDFRSPTRAVIFDEVEVLANAQVAITDTDTGYRVEAAIPVRRLVDDFIWPGRILQGDAGIIVADKTGRRVARIYRFNQATGVVNDIPTEATLGIRHWGEIEVERPAK